MYFIFHNWIDRRTGYCFRQLMNGRCTTRTDGLMQVTKADCCCTMGAAWGLMCEHCPSKGSEAYEELCLEVGYSVDGNGSWFIPDELMNIYWLSTNFVVSIFLTDIDECNTIPNLCRNGRCINTLGSYRCMCSKGYRPDHSGTRCIGIDSIIDSITV